MLQDLTRREREVLEMVSLGYTSHQIGAQLFISVRTVENHRASIRKKLDAQNTACMLRRAIQERLIEVEEPL